MRSKLFYIFLFSTFLSFGQEDTTKYYTRFRDKIVLYTDIGYASAPFRVIYPFDKSTNKLKYRHNFSPVLGFGGAYKWFALRFGFALKGTTRSVSRFGKTNYFDLGTQFQIKNWFFELGARSVRGYSIKDAYKWNDTLTSLDPNDIRSNTQTFNVSVNSWYFFNKNMNMQAVQGRTGHYEKEVRTVYLKPTFSIHGLANDSESIVPSELIDSTADRSFARQYSAIEFGLVPGYAYVNRINNWQFCAFLGIGGVVQAKFYELNDFDIRGFLGLSPRYDVRIYGGYSIPRYFAFLSLDFDNKSMRFNDLKYRQNYFTFRVTAGIRLDKESKKDKVKVATVQGNH